MNAIIGNMHIEVNHSIGEDKFDESHSHLPIIIQQDMENNIPSLSTITGYFEPIFSSLPIKFDSSFVIEFPPDE
tara:strand:+ start:188 stop:409 length:222 start_codon:yes stop_codon:yes gene_type:complete